jgi:hypothetical protein
MKPGCSPNRDRVNVGAVTIISAPVGGVTSILMSDLGRVVDNDQVRVLQVIGKGPVQNVVDILDLKSIDIDVDQDRGRPCGQEGHGAERRWPPIFLTPGDAC